jgi:regulator of protease activity HflC (stomatin/prohibitin superfamily)
MNNRRLPFIILAIIAFIVILALSSSLFYTISATERAVIFYPFGMGLDKDNIIGPGTHMKAPWNEVYSYKVNEMSSEENMDVLDKNGLSIHIDITVRYYPIPDKIGYIHEQFTTDYEAVLVIPEVRSTVRQVTGRYTAEEIYSTKRAEVETAITTETETILKQKNVHATAVLIRSIMLPEQIKVAIENKLQQEQEALAYQFRLDKEKSEAERKRIAAEGRIEGK